MTVDTNPGRWGGHPALARLVRLLVFLAPVAASVGAAALIRPLLPAAAGLWARLASLLVLILVSTLVLVAVDRLARRALPLATLLDLSMLFPDRAPSRLRVARDAIRRAPIEEQLARVAQAGADPGTVAREILTLVAALSAHDRPTRGHAERVRMFTDLLAESLRVPERDRDLLRWAAILHDVGKLRVPTTLLNKPGKPTTEEWVVLRAHPAHGAEIAGALLPWLGEWGAVIAEHHERYDGTGYPLGLGGRGISLGARIVSVADAYDVMTAARAYQRPVSRAAACRELVRFSGTQFDPTVVRAMLSVSAPRLRRAQGLLAWVSDIPLVATGSVPAATMARVVGASALATGVVAGGVGLGAVTEPTPVPAYNANAQVPGVSRQELARALETVRPISAHLPGPSIGGKGPAAAGAPQHPAQVPDVATGGSTAAAAAPSSGSAAQDGGSGSPEAAAPSHESETAGGSAPAVTAPSSTTSQSSGPVGQLLADPVGPVADVVADPVDTVTGTVDDAIGTDTGTLDGLLGSGSSGSGPSSSSGPGSGGLPGRLLGR